MTDSKKEELDKAVETLRMMFSMLERYPGQVTVGTLPDIEVITVAINGCNYKVNVECENKFQMVRSVVDAVILKI